MKIRLVIAFLTVILMTGCQTYQTTRVDVNSVTDVGDTWNDTDSRLVAEAMTDDALRGGWMKQFYRKNGDKMPVVIVTRVNDRTGEGISTKTFIGNIETAFVNSGEIEVVATAHERSDVRREREDQASNASEETAKFDGEELGADYMLKGEVNSIVNRDGRKAVKFYQISLTLIDIETHKKVWIGEKKIKKLISS